MHLSYVLAPRRCTAKPADAVASKVQASETWNMWSWRSETRLAKEQTTVPAKPPGPSDSGYHPHQGRRAYTGILGGEERGGSPSPGVSSHLIRGRLGAEWSQGLAGKRGGRDTSLGVLGDAFAGLEGEDRETWDPDCQPGRRVHRPV